MKTHHRKECEGKINCLEGYCKMTESHYFSFHNANNNQNVECLQNKAEYY